MMCDVCRGGSLDTAATNWVVGDLDGVDMLWCFIFQVSTLKTLSNCILVSPVVANKPRRANVCIVKGPDMPDEHSKWSKNDRHARNGGETKTFFCRKPNKWSKGGTDPQTKQILEADVWYLQGKGCLLSARQSHRLNLRVVHQRGDGFSGLQIPPYKSLARVFLILL